MKKGSFTNKQTKKHPKTKSYQEMNDEISTNPDLKQTQPTYDPKDFEEIEY
ncbi:hypothetical protein [Oceanobacillus senegalensis]|uniref:hypothetical protein n=1 Tax=Oceanobacillus senegalensis TaxID=1936063 RepID=UPI0015C49570|nr:hypothetical protein [Oceanobacillus senegalensis]